MGFNANVNYFMSFGARAISGVKLSQVNFMNVDVYVLNEKTSAF